MPGYLDTNQPGYGLGFNFGGGATAGYNPLNTSFAETSGGMGGMNPGAGMGMPGGMGGGIMGGGSGFGFNVPTAQLALSGLGTIGNLWAAFQAQKLAKQQFEYTKKITDTNLGNQVQSYNTALDDRINSRAKVQGLTPEQVAAYRSANALHT